MNPPQLRTSMSRGRTSTLTMRELGVVEKRLILGASFSSNAKVFYAFTKRDFPLLTLDRFEYRFLDD